MSKEALLWLCAGFGITMLVLSLINWYLADRDERSWRAGFEQARRDQIIHQRVKRRIAEREAERDGN